MLDRIAFSVGGRPVQWQRTGSHHGKRVFTPHAMRKAAKAITAAGKSAMGNRAPLTGPVRLTVVTVYAVPKSWPKKLQDAIADGAVVYKTSVPDLDNLGKLVSDALNGVAFVDDSQVAELLNRKRYGNPERTDVVIQELGGAEPGTAPMLTPSDKRRAAKADPTPQPIAGKSRRKAASILDPASPRLL